MTKRLIVVFLAVGAFILAQTPATLPNQVAFVTAQYDQAASPAFTGGVGYAVKPQTSTVPIYSYTQIRETSIVLGKSTAIQTRTETGACIYTSQFGTIRIWGCGTVGVVTANSTAKIGATGQVLLTTALGKSSWFVGVFGGPSYSGLANTAVSYPVGLVIGLGAKN